MSRTTSQLTLFKPSLSRIINVASVPQRSPFRYPGGKTWLVPRIRQWLKQPVREFIEPFAGGGIISLTVAAEQLADQVTMVELDEQVAAVWQTIIEEGDGAWLAERIGSFDLTDDSLRDVLAKETCSIRERAFQTILKNRTFRGGILAPGAAPLKQGENGKGIRSRWYPDTLKRRILDIDAIRPRLMFIQGDGPEMIRQNAHRPHTTFFVDPPYTVAGKRAGRRLYKYADLNHQALFHLMSRVAGDFLMTYDDADEVRELARTHGFDTERVAMKNTHHAEMSELLIGRNLDWARQGQNV
jgi:DNA adenine methylase